VLSLRTAKNEGSFVAADSNTAQTLATSDSSISSLDL